MPIIRQLRQDRRKKASLWFNRHAHNVVSQSGEDGIIAKIFETIGTRSKWCVEFGAWDGKHLSNTWNLIANGDWSGVLVEGSAAKHQHLVANYAGNDRAHCICGIVRPEEGPQSLESYLKATPIPRDFDLLSIDVDGVDYYIWESMREYRPRIVIVEINPTVPNDVIFVQDRDIALSQGCSALALVELGKVKGYELICVQRFNAIFAVAEEFAKLDIEDNSLDAMFLPSRHGQYWQGYDGSLWHAGLMQLGWAGKDIVLEHDTLQALPPDKRRWKDAILDADRDTSGSP